MESRLFSRFLSPDAAERLAGRASPQPFSSLGSDDNRCHYKARGGLPIGPIRRADPTRLASPDRRSLCLIRAGRAIVTGELAKSVLAIVAIPAAGYPWACLLALQGWLRAAAAWLLGAALLAEAMLALSAAQGRFIPLSLALVWLAVGGAGLLAVRWSGRSLGLPPLRAPRRGRLWFSVLAAIVIVVQIAYVWLSAVRIPLGSFDSWSLWEYKGRLFRLDGMVSGLSLHDRALIFAHPAYPPLLSLLIAWVYTWVGSATPALMKPLFPLFFGSLLLGFLAALRLRVGAAGAVLGTVAIALVPRIADYAGTGLADVPMAAFLVGGAAAYCAYRESRDPLHLVACGLLLGSAAFTKRDALPYLGTGLVLIAVLERRIAAALPAVVALAVCGPWYAYVALSGVPDRDFLPATSANITAHIDRIGPIARLFLLNLGAVDEWSVLWVVVLAALGSGLLHRRMRAPALLLLIVIPLASFVASLSLSAWPDYTEHARTSLDRLILGTCPFAIWFACEQLFPVRRERPKPPTQ